MKVEVVSMEVEFLIHCLGFITLDDLNDFFTLFVSSDRHLSDYFIDLVNLYSLH